MCVRALIRSHAHKRWAHCCVGLEHSWDFRDHLCFHDVHACDRHWRAPRLDRCTHIHTHTPNAINFNSTDIPDRMDVSVRRKKAIKYSSDEKGTSTGSRARGGGKGGGYGPPTTSTWLDSNVYLFIFHHSNHIFHAHER